MRAVTAAHADAVPCAPLAVQHPTGRLHSVIDVYKSVSTVQAQQQPDHGVAVPCPDRLNTVLQCHCSAPPVPDCPESAHSAWLPRRNSKPALRFISRTKPSSPPARGPGWREAAARISLHAHTCSIFKFGPDGRTLLSRAFGPASRRSTAQPSTQLSPCGPVVT